MGTGICFLPGWVAGARAVRQLLPVAAGLCCCFRTDAPAAPPAGVVYVCDSSDDRVMRLTDRDGSGVVELEAPGEVTVFFDDASEGADLSTPSHLVWGTDGKLYLLDGGTLDAILTLRDANDDGDANDPG